MLINVKVSSNHAIIFFSWTHFSFRFDNTGCRARREFRGNCLKRSWKRGISDCIHRLPIVLRELAALQFYTNPLRFCWGDFIEKKSQIHLSVLLFSPCFRQLLWPILSIIWTESVTSSHFPSILALLDTGKPFKSNQYGYYDK